MPKVKLQQDTDRDLKILLAGSAQVEGKSAADIAAVMDVSPRQVYRYLSRPGELPFDKLRRLARHLNIPIEKFRETVKY